MLHFVLLVSLALGFCLASWLLRRRWESRSREDKSGGGAYRTPNKREIAK